MDRTVEFRITAGDIVNPASLSSIFSANADRDLAQDLQPGQNKVADQSSLGFVINGGENEPLLASKLAGVDPRGAALAEQNSSAAQKEKRDRENRSTSMLLALLDRINDRITDLSRQLEKAEKRIDNLEDQLRSEYGEDFLDVAAQMHLDEDQLAELKDLSGQDREARTRDLLTAKVLNDDGSIKDEYRDVPIAVLMSEYRNKDHLKDRKDNLQQALESGDPTAQEQALKQDDEWADDAQRNAIKASQNTSLTSTFTNANSPEKSMVAAAIDKSMDVAAESNTDLKIKGLEDFGMA